MAPGFRLVMGREERKGKAGDDGNGPKRLIANRRADVLRPLVSLRLLAERGVCAWWPPLRRWMGGGGWVHATAFYLEFWSELGRNLFFSCGFSRALRKKGRTGGGEGGAAEGWVGRSRQQAAPQVLKQRSLLRLCGRQSRLDETSHQLLLCTFLPPGVGGPVSFFRLLLSLRFHEGIAGAWVDPNFARPAVCHRCPRSFWLAHKLVVLQP